jgi:hypothetical protein
MAKPKGGTLTRLFEVSERERQDFYENLQKKLRPTPEIALTQEKGIPDKGTPGKGVPYSGTPDTATDTGASDEPAVVNQSAQRELPPKQRPKSTGIHISGTAVSGIPVSGIPTMTVPEEGIPATGSLSPLTKPKIRRAAQVQDGHSLGEQLVLTTLWNNASAIEGQSYRRITIGYRTLSGICGLTVNNCKANLKSLQTKLAIEPEAGYSSTTGTTYRVLSFAEILRRREAAGLTHVIRSKGSQFVNPVTGIPVTGTPVAGIHLPDPGTPKREKGIPVSGEKGIPAPGRQLIIKKEDPSKELESAYVVVVSTAIRKHLTIDDAAVLQIITNCIQQDPQATSEEIAHFTQLKIQQHRNNPAIQNLPGLLIHSVQDYFRPASTELADFRNSKAQQKARGREVAQQILDDPESPDADKAWAREVLGSN